jgi:hypothetical protein
MYKYSTGKQLLACTLKMEVIVSSETLIITYKATRRRKELRDSCQLHAHSPL